MQFHFTARKFRAHATLREHAAGAVMRLPKYYDGIVRGDVVLGFERSSNSVKWAELTIHVHGTVLTSREKSEDFVKSIDMAVGKMERQLSKYKSRVRLKNKKTLRKVKEDAVSKDDEE
jgi:putative sigma-54 modulation protein